MLVIKLVQQDRLVQHSVWVSAFQVIRVLQHATFLRRGRQPEVSCFPI